MKKNTTGFVDYFWENGRPINALRGKYCSISLLKGYSKFYFIYLLLARLEGVKFEFIKATLTKSNGYLLRETSYNAFKDGYNR